MKIALASLMMMALQSVQMAVDDPVLPDGALAYMGSAGPTRVYVDASSWERSNLPGMVRGTAVIVSPDGPAPVMVMLMWVDCGRGVFQLSSGRAYDDTGTQVTTTAYQADAPIGQRGPIKHLADAVCVTPFAFDSPEVEDWRLDLAETRAAASGTAQGTEP